MFDKTFGAFSFKKFLVLKKVLSVPEPPFAEIFKFFTGIIAALVAVSNTFSFAAEMKGFTALAAFNVGLCAGAWLHVPGISGATSAETAACRYTASVFF